MKKEFITYGIIIDPKKFERIKNGRKNVYEQARRRTLD